jgi:hypothetical protein
MRNKKCECGSVIIIYRCVDCDQPYCHECADPNGDICDCGGGILQIHGRSASQVEIHSPIGQRRNNYTKRR